MKILIVVDMQNDFITGPLGTDEAKVALANTVTRLQNVTDELVLVTYDTHGDDYLDTPEGKKLPVVHCIKDTQGWQLAPEIAGVLKEYRTFEKPVFGSTDLVDFLLANQEDITEIELLGVCTDICVVSNAIMIKNAMPNIPIYVNEKCSAGVTAETHDQAINVMKMCQIDII